jgi:hypothetical protein
MQIWIDLRFLKDDYYSFFVLELIKWLINKDKTNTYIIYLNTITKDLEKENTILRHVWISNDTFKEQFNFYRILKKDNNNLVLFFNTYKPFLYKWNYITIIDNLKNIVYNNFKGSASKYYYLFKLKNNLRYSNKIVCLDKITKNEILERFNIKEEKINILNAFFNIEKNTKKPVVDINIDIKSKYQINWKYFIYEWWNWLEKNIEKIISVINRLKKQNIYLIILWYEVSKNNYISSIVKKLKINDKVKILWVIKESEAELLYKNSLWVLFPSFYESFPFDLTNAIKYQTLIFANKLENIKNIFNNNIIYFDAKSTNKIQEIIEEHLEKQTKIKNISYNITDKYNKDNAVNNLIKIIK